MSDMSVPDSSVRDPLKPQRESETHSADELGDDHRVVHGETTAHQKDILKHSAAETLGSDPSAKVKTQKGDSTRKRGDLRPDRCHFYLERKRRYCRTTPPEGKYCVEHLMMVPSAPGLESEIGNDSSSPAAKKRRIKCPLDPKHTCYENHLQKHLKKCNARPNAQPVYYENGINSGYIGDGESVVATVRTAEVEEVKAMIELVNQLYEEKVGELKKEILSHEALKEELENPQNGAPARKHLSQQASLVGHIEKLGFLQDGFCHIEFGAGKGGLSHWVQRALQTCDDTKFLLVEKSSVRYKMDVYHRGVHQGPDFERLRVDIEHLNLNKVPSLLDNHRPILGLGKHLCGGATDLMLRCLMQTLKPGGNSEDRNPHVEGIVLALCCHHRCDWKSFIAKDVMKRWGVGPREFSLLSSLTGWATCATRAFIEKLKENGDNEDQELSEDEQIAADGNQEYNHPKYGSMTPEYREEVGYKCKKLIDMARVQYLRDNEFSTDMIAYADLSTTLENVVLVAKRKPQKDSTITLESTQEPSSTSDIAL